jgi:hypothetical protein
MHISIVEIPSHILSKLLISENRRACARGRQVVRCPTSSPLRRARRNDCQGCRNCCRSAHYGHDKSWKMTRVKIRYYVLKRGQGFWQPTKKMRVLGFYAVPCGKDGPKAWATAELWNNRWDATRHEGAPSPAMADADNLSAERSEELTVYPHGSLGEAFKRYRRTYEWGSGKAPRTQRTGGAHGSGSSQYLEIAIHGQ